MSEIGNLIADVIEKVGKDGVVTVEEGQGLTLESEVVEGFTMDRGFVSPYMVTDTARMEAVYDKPAIVITDKKISSIQEFLPLLEKLAQAGKKDLVLIAEDVEGEALGTLILNRLKGVFNTVAVKAPAFGDRRKEILEDIAILTGGEVITEDRGMTFENAELDVVGYCPQSYRHQRRNDHHRRRRHGRCGEGPHNQIKQANCSRYQRIRQRKSRKAPGRT